MADPTPEIPSDEVLGKTYVANHDVLGAIGTNQHAIALRAVARAAVEHYKGMQRETCNYVGDDELFPCTLVRGHDGPHDDDALPPPRESGTGQREPVLGPTAHLVERSTRAAASGDEADNGGAAGGASGYVWRCRDCAFECCNQDHDDGHADCSGVAFNHMCFASCTAHTPARAGEDVEARPLEFLVGDWHRALVEFELRRAPTSSEVSATWKRVETAIAALREQRRRAEVAEAALAEEREANQTARDLIANAQALVDRLATTKQPRG